MLTELKAHHTAGKMALYYAKLHEEGCTDRQITAGIDRLAGEVARIMEGRP
jgi:hypothetical protein